MDKHKGFTIVEVALFLAVTAALFIGIALAMQNAITQQRFNDATQNFYEFMKSIYSKVSNPQSPGYGNSSDYAIYGKLVVFGEQKDITGADVPSDEHPIFTYDVVGDTKINIGTGNLNAILSNQNVDVMRCEGIWSSKKCVLATPEKYEMRWQMSLEDTEGNEFKGSILVVRDPSFGTINTLFLKDTIEVNSKTFDKESNLLEGYLVKGDGSTSNIFEPAEIDFCINAYSLGESGVIPRQNIRVIENARNASGVELIEQDKEFVRFDSGGNNEGNKCLK